MKIAIDCRLINRRTSGIGKYNYYLIKELSRLDDDNEYKMILGGSELPRELQLGNNFKPVRLGFRQGFIDWPILLTGFPKIELFTGKVDIIHGTSFFPWAKRNGKFIATVHDLALLKFPKLVPKKLGLYYKLCGRKFIPNADFIITDSENTRKDVIEYFKVDESRVKTVYLGYDKYGIESIIAENPRRLFDYPYILFVGTIEPRKNLIRLIKSFNILKNNHKIPHKLLLVGNKGWSNENIYAEVSASPYKDEILIVGNKTEEELVSLYYYADVFVLVSIYEGFGLPLLEAMSCGTPVVFADNSSLPEIAGDCGIPVSPFDIESITDGIFSVLDRRELAKSLSIAARKRANKFLWKKTASETLKIYREVGT